MIFLNYYREEMNTERDTEPIGIVPGAFQDKLVMHYALQSFTNQVFVSREAVGRRPGAVFSTVAACSKCSNLRQGPRKSGAPGNPK